MQIRKPMAAFSKNGTIWYLQRHFLLTPLRKCHYSCCFLQCHFHAQKWVTYYSLSLSLYIYITETFDIFIDILRICHVIINFFEKLNYLILHIIVIFLIKFNLLLKIFTSHPITTSLLPINPFFFFATIQTLESFNG